MEKNCVTREHFNPMRSNRDRLAGIAFENFFKITEMDNKCKNTNKILKLPKHVIIKLVSNKTAI